MPLYNRPSLVPDPVANGSTCLLHGHKSPPQIDALGAIPEITLLPWTKWLVHCIEVPLYLTIQCIICNEFPVSAAAYLFLDGSLGTLPGTSFMGVCSVDGGMTDGGGATVSGW